MAHPQKILTSNLLSYLLRLDLKDLPPALERKLGKQVINSTLLHAYFGGQAGWWRTQSTPRAEYSAHILENVDIRFEVCVESLIFDSHHDCARCTWAAGFRIEGDTREEIETTGEINPEMCFAWVPGGAGNGPWPKNVCDADAMSGGPLLTLKVKTRRYIKPTMTLFRRQLIKAHCERLPPPPPA